MEISIGGRSIRLKIPEGVYRPSDDSFMLLDAIELNPASNDDFCLDVGCGSGIITLALAIYSYRVLAIDLIFKASRSTWLNAIANKLDDRVDVICSDLLTSVRSSVKFDYITFNPPYLPIEAEDLDDIAWCGGEGGREILDKFIEGIRMRLGKGMRIIIVQSSLSSPDIMISKLRGLGMEVSTDKRPLPFFEDLYLIIASSGREDGAN